MGIPFVLHLNNLSPRYDYTVPGCTCLDVVEGNLFESCGVDPENELCVVDALKACAAGARKQIVCRTTGPRQLHP